ncbi:hypothetical protein GEV33_007916 [Tenebrio molitor]|uniref:Uncharacterized protein n=1 Tax=Tenebrio molitor TaxID=7067 RepID=A0A8J6HHR2_TENMO|nr:hypothetical protein GEV33_007916 [Tenebrio molitor]
MFREQYLTALQGRIYLDYVCCRRESAGSCWQDVTRSCTYFTGAEINQCSAGRHRYPSFYCETSKTEIGPRRFIILGQDECAQSHVGPDVTPPPTSCCGFACLQDAASYCACWLKCDRRIRHLQVLRGSMCYAIMRPKEQIKGQRLRAWARGYRYGSAEEAPDGWMPSGSVSDHPSDSCPHPPLLNFSDRI